MSALTALRDRLAHLTQAEEGQGMVEYALIIALVSIACVAILVTMGGTISDVFDSIVKTLAGG